MPKKIYWIIGLLLFVCVDVSADIESEDKQAFHNLIAKYMEYFIREIRMEFYLCIPMMQ